MNNIASFLQIYLSPIKGRRTSHFCRNVNLKLMMDAQRQPQ